MNLTSIQWTCVNVSDGLSKRRRCDSALRYLICGNPSAPAARPVWQRYGALTDFGDCRQGLRDAGASARMAPG